ncbi:MAG: rRNA maturation RNase YbeY [Candidatus Marinimicrobia bacterium]|jgi:rRNA maturation RNase YbeY|nr:rRNA maturation RNase YbeY [Candidatus Neomarinimicrobiota bacterium]MDP6593434.1 rRNA maturation RNase YbeY [Candidatus Neomarinimicrobiota bacterium]MDP6836533.1 rRNA maturation RNase YbeY [Candidatus Neomarinimicrobiota bacterium]MDP6965809.1 rRNA maturation RNase YbeY [Candidatus Neomarinimicrobiota bacterium]|tara:strand:- start:2921 stop:3361 length:441 start_codon:yes stop_codon:yes gene_type:complete
MTSVKTEVVNTDLSPDAETVSDLVTSILADGGVQLGDVTVIFGGDGMLHSLKRQFFHKDEYTDVIAFRLDASPDEQFEGEIYISVERAAENAGIFGVSLANELGRLICHGALHLLGYNDDTDERKTEMREFENRYLSQFSVDRFLS